MVRRCAASLLRHEAGNTLAVVAFAVLMLLAAVGGGVDMSRAYMVKTNLQSACDAGVLAGRKALSRTGDYGSAEKAKADKMFAFNFRKSAEQSHDVTFTSQAHDDGSVTGTATAAMPTTIMAVFKFGDMDLKAECSAELQMASADVMFVLDVTGSMAGNRLDGLRDAVRDFHTTVANAVIDKDRTVIRYGFVPYSMTVNASNIVASGALPAGAFADNTPYQTRVAYFNTAHYLPNEPTVSVTQETYGSSITQSNCTKYANNTYPSSSGKNPVTGGGPAPKATTSTLYSAPTSGAWTRTSGSGSSAVGTCKRNKTVSTTDYTTVYKFTQWRYKQATIDTTGVVPGGGSLITSLSTNDDYYVPERGEYDMRTLAKMRGAENTYLPAPTTHAWNGCIEERQTVVDLAMNPVPDGALDLDINSAPIADNDNTKWKPYWGIVEYNRSSSTSGSMVTERCPAPMRQFQEVDTKNPNTVPAWLNTYLNNLTAVGNTYHDIGMIWGARLASTRGMFAANVLEGNRTSVSRHIIFMTDGQMEPSRTGYNAYGIEDLDRRIAPSGSGTGANSTLATYHTNRFLAACRAAREEGYTIWVISFGTGITNAMRTCASADRAYQASNTTELRNAFRYIAGQVADLRLKR